MLTMVIDSDRWQAFAGKQPVHRGHIVLEIIEQRAVPVPDDVTLMRYFTEKCTHCDLVNDHVIAAKFFRAFEREFCAFDEFFGRAIAACACDTDRDSDRE